MLASLWSESVGWPLQRGAPHGERSQPRAEQHAKSRLRILWGVLLLIVTSRKALLVVSGGVLLLYKYQTWNDRAGGRTLAPQGLRWPDPLADP